MLLVSIDHGNYLILWQFKCLTSVYVRFERWVVERTVWICRIENEARKKKERYRGFCTAERRGCIADRYSKLCPTASTAVQADASPAPIFCKTFRLEQPCQ